jgi:hypothetical protein
MNKKYLQIKIINYNVTMDQMMDQTDKTGKIQCKYTN